MDSFIVLDYSNVFLGHIRFDAFGHISIRSNGRYSRRGAKNKYAFICPEAPGRSASDAIDARVKWYTSGSEKLFVSPQCRIARDLFRKSNYKIVRDKDRADIVVIPKPSQPREFIYYDIIYKEGANLYLYTVDRNEKLRRTYNTYNEEDFNKIKDYFGSNVVWYCNSILHNGVCQFLQKCEEYKEVLSELPKYQFIYETLVKIDYPIDICLDTLRTWRYCEDWDILAKAICNSNWKDYPVTLCVFFYCEKGMVNYYGGQNMKLILEQIGFDKYTSLEALLAERVIQPKDWNLLQDYIMDVFHLSENGGFTNPESTSLLSLYKELVKTRYAVVPMRINTPMSYENISLLLK